MPFSTINGRNVPIEIWSPVHELDSKVVAQLKNVAGLPWVAHHVAVMPDVHLGRGATVGSVIALRGAIAPAAVGVDIGCGMAAVAPRSRRSQLPDDLRALREAIEAAIPVGMTAHDAPVWEALPDDARQAGGQLMATLRRARAQGRRSRRARRLPARHPRRRQSLHRGLPRHDRHRLVDAPLGQPPHRRRAGAAPHRDGAPARATTRRWRTATWPCSWRERRRSTATGAISTGPRTTLASTGEVMLALLAEVMRRRWPQVEFRGGDLLPPQLRRRGASLR